MRALGIGRIMPFLFLFLDTTDILAVEAQVKLSGRLHVLIDALVKKGHATQTTQTLTRADADNLSGRVTQPKSHVRFANSMVARTTPVLFVNRRSRRRCKLAREHSRLHQFEHRANKCLLLASSCAMLARPK